MFWTFLKTTEHLWLHVCAVACGHSEAPLPLKGGLLVSHNTSIYKIKGEIAFWLKRWRAAFTFELWGLSEHQTN